MTKKSGTSYTKRYKTGLESAQRHHAKGTEYMPTSDAGKQAKKDFMNQLKQKEQTKAAPEKKEEIKAAPEKKEKQEFIHAKKTHEEIYPTQQAEKSHIIPLHKGKSVLEYKTSLAYVKDHHHLTGYAAAPTAVHGFGADSLAPGATHSQLEPVESKEAQFLKKSNTQFKEDQRGQYKITPRLEYLMRKGHAEQAISYHYETQEPEQPPEAPLEAQPVSMQERPFHAEGVEPSAYDLNYRDYEHRPRTEEPINEMERDTNLMENYRRNVMHNRFVAAEQMQGDWPLAGRQYDLLDNEPEQRPAITANPSENIPAHPANPTVAKQEEPITWWEYLTGATRAAKEAAKEAKQAIKVNSRAGDIDARTISEDSVFDQGLVNEQNQLLKGVLLKMNKNIAGKQEPVFLSFDNWQEMVHNRFKEALQLQIDKAVRDEEIMDLSQKNRILERNELFRQMYFTPLVA